MSLPSFGVRKPVPANLLMIAMIIGGIASAVFMRREFLPEINPEAARIELVYPGATPQEIEESMARKVEDAVSTIDGVKRIETTVAENVGVVLVKFNEGSDVEKGVKEVERAIERLSDLPDDAERIRVIEFVPNLPVIMATLCGARRSAVLGEACTGSSSLRSEYSPVTTKFKTRDVVCTDRSERFKSTQSATARPRDPLPQHCAGPRPVSQPPRGQ